MGHALIMGLFGEALSLPLGASAVDMRVKLAQVPDLSRNTDLASSNFELYLTALTVILGVGFIGLYSYFNRNKIDKTFSRNFIILTVIFSALFLIVAGYSEQQTAPVFGLLGTIIGYLFGISTTKTKQPSGQLQEDRELLSSCKGGYPYARI